MSIEPWTSATQVYLNCFFSYTTPILDLDHLVRTKEYNHIKILDLRSNTCLNNSERSVSDPNDWGPRLNADRGNVLLLDFFHFHIVKHVSHKCQFRLFCEKLDCHFGMAGILVFHFHVTFSCTFVTYQEKTLGSLEMVYSRHIFLIISREILSSRWRRWVPTNDGDTQTFPRITKIT